MSGIELQTDGGSSVPAAGLRAHPREMLAVFILVKNPLPSVRFCSGCGNPRPQAHALPCSLATSACGVGQAKHVALNGTPAFASMPVVSFRLCLFPSLCWSSTASRKPKSVSFPSVFQRSLCRTGLISSFSFIVFVYLFFKNLFLSLLKRQIHREKINREKDPLSIGSLLKWPQLPELR